MNALTQLQPQSSGSLDLALLFDAVEAFPESLAIVEAGVLVYTNPAWAQVFEYADPAPLQGRALEEFIPKPCSRKIADGADGGSQNCGDTEYPHLRRDGTQVQLQVACAGFSTRGRNYQVIGTRDVSGKNQIERRLQKSRRLEAIGRLVGGVAHDFNNLLTGLMLYCDLLIRDSDENSPCRHYAEEMHQAGQQGAKLIQQLFAVARPAPEAATGLVLNEVIHGVEELLARLIGENITLLTLLATDLGQVRIDPALVQQALLNLVLNARDAMPAGGQINLTTRNCTEYLPTDSDSKPRLMPCVELTVTDNGCGMDAEILSRAFEPFFTTKKPGRGTGLGLASVWHLARQAGGTVIAESEPGKGTRVSLRLPRVIQGPFDPTTSDSKVQR